MSPAPNIIALFERPNLFDPRVALSGFVAFVLDVDRATHSDFS